MRALAPKAKHRFWTIVVWLLCWGGLKYISVIKLYILFSWLSLHCGLILWWRRNNVFIRGKFPVLWRMGQIKQEENIIIFATVTKWCKCKRDRRQGVCFFLRTEKQINSDWPTSVLFLHFPEHSNKTRLTKHGIWPCDISLHPPLALHAKTQLWCFHADTTKTCSAW